MKKILALLMTCIMAISLATTAFATDDEWPDYWTAPRDTPKDKLIVEVYVEDDVSKENVNVKYTDGMTIDDIIARVPACKIRVELGDGHYKTLESTWYADEEDAAAFEKDPAACTGIWLYANDPEGYTLAYGDLRAEYPQRFVHLKLDSNIITGITKPDYADRNVQLTYHDGDTLDSLIAQVPYNTIEVTLDDGSTKTLEITWRANEIDADAFNEDPTSISMIQLHANVPNGYVLADNLVGNTLPSVWIELVKDAQTPETPDSGNTDKPDAGDTGSTETPSTPSTPSTDKPDADNNTATTVTATSTTNQAGTTAKTDTAAKTATSQTKSPKTADESHALLAVSALALSAATLTCAAVVTKKRKDA